MNVPNKAYHRLLFYTKFSEKFVFNYIKTFKYADLGTSKTLVVMSLASTKYDEMSTCCQYFIGKIEFQEENMTFNHI